MKWKRAKMWKKGKQVFGLISLAKGGIVTLSLRHSLTEACSCEYVVLCLFEGVCTYICRPYMHEYICECVHLCVCTGTFPCAWLVWALWAFAVALKMKGIVFTYTHVHLQISLWLPACSHAGKGGNTHFPTAFVEPHYLLTLNQLLSNTLSYPPTRDDTAIHRIEELFHKPSN